VKDKDGHDIVTLQVTCKLNEKLSPPTEIYACVVWYFFYWVWESLKTFTFTKFVDLS